MTWQRRFSGRYLPHRAWPPRKLSVNSAAVVILGENLTFSGAACLLRCARAAANYPGLHTRR